ncbi:DNA topoisomerase I [Sporanaerobium hydrogeniformans]|uniref:DNA topoisomerase I n=1 Tax=Sporanaerobium hydrogeniformans TaxID=3072179 RepID=A0AC61DEV6_9FIRM|nr:type I DNA topoisomerase [Sporanaerobium hydrogeniformans]PHV71102.1 DNA topoisomerase I [Sporanaerobium hydrogeniformans]
MADNLVIVESAAKVNTISRFLGKNYKVEASMGHVRDLPKSQLGIDVENNYEPKYITIRGKGELLQKIRKEVKGADNIYLATDPDREGEAISWHLFHTLKLQDKNVYRITFNEITEKAVKEALKHPRTINMDLVDAQQARRVLDRLVGYKISPILWKKVRKGLSAGRVQSVTLRLISDREKEIREFVEEEYWSIEVHLSANKSKAFEAKLESKGDQKITIANEQEAKAIIAACEKGEFHVISTKKSNRIKNTVLPFTTSTMQQEAAKHLGFSTQKTMNIAQQLYEGIKVGKKEVGVITYLRTDSVRIADKAKEEAALYIKEKFGENYLGEQKDNGKAKKINIQDAHEAIRPTYMEYEPSVIKEYLSRDQYRLYHLIWNRFLASQMAPAEYETHSIKIQNGDYIFKTAYSITLFEGFMKAYNLNEEKTKKTNLLQVQEGQSLQCGSMIPNQHFTQPPARFSEAMLVKTLEENGVGRPSTYAPTITTLLARGYIVKENKMLYPTELGEVVNHIMLEQFDEIVDVEFTANMERILDEIAAGNVEWKEIIKSFYPHFNQTVLKAEAEVQNVDLTEKTDIPCEKCGTHLIVRYGKYGKFLGCPSFPECNFTKPWYEETGIVCPICGGKVLIKKTKKGRTYYGCENNGENCEFMSWEKPTGDKCPACGDVLVEKGNSKNKKTVCRNTTCNYGKQNK